MKKLSEMRIDEMAELFCDNAELHGFWDGVNRPDEEVPKKLMLVVEEAVEALGEYRSNRLLDGIYYRPSDGKPEGFGVEIGDAIIRLAELYAKMRRTYPSLPPLSQCMGEKHEFNVGRPHKHGRTC